MVDFANSEFYSANVSTLTTDFNVTPYYDDYDAKNNYYRILFKPGFAVQARELTQIQTMVQEQISRFGQHIFKEGSKVLGSRPVVELNTPYVKVLDNDAFDNEVTLDNFVGEWVTGQVTGIRAYVNLVLEGVETSQNTKTLYVSYNSSNPDTNEVTFADGETLVANVGTLVVGTSATGYGSVLTVSEGVRYAKKHFIHHNTQSIVVDRYGQSPTCKVGLYIAEDLINSSQDSSLLDPALESSNYAAPGADRLKLTPTLQRLDIDEVVGPPDYVSILEIRNGTIYELNERPVYNVVQDEVSKRTYDESGDYYVRGLNVVVQEHLKLSNNFGYLISSEGGNSSLLSVQVEPGLAYVRGFEIPKRTTTFLTTEKSTTYNNVNSQIVSSKLGNYIKLTEVVGAWYMDTGVKIDLYDTAQTRITSGKWSTGSQTGKKIGTARVKSISYDSGVLGTATGNLNLHIFDVQMLGSNAFSNVKSVYYDNASSADIGADVILTNGKCALNDAGAQLTYLVGKDAVRTVRASDGSVDTTFSFKKTSDVTIDATGTFTVTNSITNEIFPYGGTLSSADERDIIVNLNQAVSISFGTALSAVGTTLNGNATNFTRLNVGDKIELSGNSKTYIIASISNNTTLSVTANLPSISSNSISKVFKSGDLIDLSGIGSLGVARSATSSSTSLTVNLQENFGTNIPGTVTYRMSRTSAKEVTKNLRSNRYVKISCSSAGTSGPFNLGFSDVFKIKNVWKKSSTFSTEDPSTESGVTDVTSLFTFDNGQRDDYYGFGTITPAGVSLSSGDYLLVRLDYFVPDFTLGSGYFSVDSYPINDSSPSSSQITTAEIPTYTSLVNGSQIDLRNVLDFRPVYQSKATDSTTVAGASSNPASADTFLYGGTGLRLPADSEDITFDYSYYLKRKDAVALGADGVFRIIKGIASETPITPQVPDEYMSCASINIPAYPSISLDYAKYLGRINLGCTTKKTLNIRYTMRDIGVLEQRIYNLEQYVSLNLLEKSVLDLKILDENKLDRFKNGIFIDTFTDFSLSDRGNIDNHISFDPDEKSIRPLYDFQSLRYTPYSNSNCVIVGDYVMLPYTEVTLLDQPYATTYRNVETTVYKFVGKLFLTPDKDFWVNTQRLQTQTVEFNDPNLNYTPYSVSYGAWSAWQGGTPGAKSSWNDVNIPGAINLLNPGGGGSFGSWGTGTGPGITAFLNYAAALGPDQLTVAKNFIASGAVSGFDAYSTATSTRQIIETFQSLSTITKSFGNKVVDVSLISDIRPQIIAFHGIGLKANTRYYIFFDGKLMSDYVTPSSSILDMLPTGLGQPDSGDWPIAGRYYDATGAGVEGSSLYSDSKGNVYGLLRLPSDGSVTFRVGTKEVIITDSPTNEADATSAAKTYFVAEGIQQTKQEQIISTKKVVTQVVPSSEERKALVIYDAPSCMAYSFKVGVDANIEGVFLSSVDVFFAAKDPDLGIWFEIRAMDNSGNITRTQVPGSEVWLKSSQVLTSDDGSVATNVKFRAPIFLENDTEYAFVIHTEGINPNYYMYVCVLGEADILTKNQISQRALRGTLYTTNNNLDWDPVQRTDLKVKFKRASFTENVQGTAILGNEPFEYLYANTLSAPLSSPGEFFLGDDKLVLSTVTGGTIAVGDLLIGQTSGVNSSVIAINGSTYTMSNTGYSVGEALKTANANGTIIGATSNVASKSTAGGFLYEYLNIYNQNRVSLTSSNGKFFTGDTMRGTLTGQSFTVESIDAFRYATIKFEPSYISFTSAPCTFEMRTVANTGSVKSYVQVSPGILDYLPEENIVYSRTNEIVNLSGASSNFVRASLITATNYLSPIIDLPKTYSLYVHNRVNSNTTGETATTGGGLLNKYISQIINLADGQDAEDLRIILSAYRPPGSNSDIKVYVRISNAEDFEPISMRNWIELEYFDSSAYSSLANRYDWREYSFKFPDSSMVGINDQSLPIVGYTNGAGTTFQTFKQYQIKIALQSDNSAVYPRVADLRVIALQK